MRRYCFVDHEGRYFPLFAVFVFVQQPEYICSNYAAHFSKRLIGKCIVKSP
nr:MAG TPA: hypothetical protein [Caudoviricetes sp.]